MDELQSIKDRYKRRTEAGVSDRYPAFSAFQHFSRAEREWWYGSLLTGQFGINKDLSVLEIGAGTGDNLIFFRRFGISAEMIWANELLSERAEHLKNWIPSANVIVGNAADLGWTEKFDVVIQSTVFSSILDEKFRQNLSAKMWEMLKPGGVILWYDFIYNNPSNADVRGVPWRQVISYFPQAEVIRHKKVTLAPPLGRRVGRLYNFINFPFLRTHCIGLFSKPN